ncbi:MAG TPA: murein transglycosylase B, partial [Erwinia persicina]|nr:murein transglycosylase B [Erwinia persicina]
MRYLALFLPVLALLTACSSQPKSAPAEPHGNPFKGNGGFLLEPSHSGTVLGGDFANNPAANAFIDKMVQKHGFERDQLHNVLAQAK